MKRLCLSVLACMMLFSAEAQNVRVGVKGGIDVAKMSMSKDLFDSSNRMGFYIGPTLKCDLPVVLGLGLDFSVLYDQRSSELTSSITGLTDGGKNYALTSETEITQRQIIIPLNVRYTFGLGQSLNVFVFAGPQVGFHIGDKVKELPDEVREWQFKSSNFSVNVGGGVTFGPLQVTANYNVGVGKTGEVTFKDALQAASDGWDGRYNSWQVGLGYFF